MQPEDRLDALLSSRGLNGHLSADSPATNSLNGHSAGNDLQPLLDAAKRLTALASATPSADFSDNLEAQIFAQAGLLEEQLGAEPTLANAPTLPPEQDMAALVRHDAPTIPGIAWGVRPDDATEIDLAPPARHDAWPRQRSRWTRLLGPALAATLILALGAATFTAALAADPGSPFYGLHRWEQGVQVNMAGSAAERARLHLASAQDALTALDAAVAQHETGATYNEALATFRDEMSAAKMNLDAVPAGADHDALTTQLTTLQTQGRADLRAALVSLPWPERVTTTSALAALGDDVLHVTQTQMVYAGHGQHLWTITVTGTGFQQGAELLVNGQPAGAVIVSVASTTLVAHMSGDDSAPLPSSVGVANPDHTAAVTSSISSHEQEDVGTPTPGGDDHGDDNQGNGGGDDHGGSGGGGDNSGKGSSGGSGGSGGSGH